MNRGITVDDAVNKRIERQIQHLQINRDTLIIDADTHPSPVEELSGVIREKYDTHADYYHGKPVSVQNLTAEMHMSGVDMCLIWQNPAVVPYTEERDENYDALYTSNRFIRDTADARPQQFIPAGWTDPQALGVEKALRLAEICITEFGFFIVKMNPAQNEFPIDSDNVKTVADRIVELGAVPAFHFGADTPYTPVAGLRSLAQRYDGHPILAVHMGGGGASYVDAESHYQQSRQLGLEYPNIRFVLSAKRETHIESDLIAYQSAGEPFCRNLFMASDTPYGVQRWNFSGARAILQGLMDSEHHYDPRVRRNPGLFDESAVQAYLGGNCARFAIQGYQRVLEKQF